MIGEVVGVPVGAAVGVAVGAAVGVAVGAAVGVAVGADVGVAVGADVGVAVGEDVGDVVGELVGDPVGEAVCVGVAVGVGVTPGRTEPEFPPGPLQATASAHPAKTAESVIGERITRIFLRVLKSKRLLLSRVRVIPRMPSLPQGVDA